MALDKFEGYFNQKIIKANKNLNVEFDMEAAVYDYDSLIKDTQ